MERFIQIIYRLGVAVVVGGVAISYGWILLNVVPLMLEGTVEDLDTKIVILLVVVWSGPALIGYGLYRLLRWVLKPNK